jgi:hypothetical protein
MVAKLFLLQLVIFVRYGVRLALHDFHRSAATAQTLVLAFLVSDKNSCISLKNSFATISSSNFKN